MAHDLPVVFHSEARRDALEAYTWYLKQSESAAIAFESELEAARIAISRSPLMWGNYLWGTRRYLLKKFPYAVVYRVHETRIEVLAVAHGKRRPFWRNRM